MLQEAKTRIDVLENNLQIATHRLAAQHQQISAMGDIMTTANLLASDYEPSSADPLLLLGSDENE
jgi:hypothetical protein